jgi:hypothetical protein
LRALEGELRKITGTTSVRRAPTNYLKTIERFDQRLGILSDLIPIEETSPKDTLSGYDRLAALVGVQIVLWVEDLERFESSADATLAKVAPIHALLHLLQQFEHITVVLASNSLVTRIDLEKTARFVESIPRLEPGTVRPIVSRFRQGCFDLSKKMGHLDPADPSVRKQLSAADDDQSSVSFIEGMLGSASSLKGGLFHLCRTPRVLKQALRAALDIWDHLAGEIDFDDVLLVSAVRSSTSPVFAAVEQYIDVLRDGPSKYRKDEQRDDSAFRAELDKIAGKDSTDRRALDKIFDFVFANTRLGGFHQRQSKPQGLDVHGHCDYWARFLGVPLLEDFERDQPVLRAISDWDEAGASTELVSLVSTSERSRAVEDFVQVISSAGLIRLLEAVVEARCKERPSSWPEGDFENRTAPGVVSIWRMFHRKREMGAHDEVSLAKSIEGLLSRSVANNLNLAHELVYYFFTPTERVFPLVRDEDVTGLTTRVVEELRAFSDRPPEALAHALDGASPWTLLWVTFRMDRIRNGPPLPVPPFSGWTDFAKAIMAATLAEPLIMVPQLIPFLVSDKDSISFKDSGIRRAYSFEADRAEALFGLDRLIEVLGSNVVPPEDIPAAMRERYLVAMTGIGERRRS